MAYPLVTIHNSTNFNVEGKVSYLSFFCSDDNYSATPGTTWKAKSRGVCLVTEITALVKTPNGDIQATPYTSSGTSYSKFAVIPVGGENKFAVTRIVSAMEDKVPADYVEPTENQKS
ncbi:MAG: hypothetical protein ACE5OZ_18855 [Candidatus Heimdallarchaeota archaeon]